MDNEQLNRLTPSTLAMLSLAMRRIMENVEDGDDFKTLDMMLSSINKTGIINCGDEFWQELEKVISFALV